MHLRILVAGVVAAASLLSMNCATLNSKDQGSDEVMAALGELNRGGLAAFSEEDLRASWPWKLERDESPIITSPAPVCAPASDLIGQAMAAEVTFMFDSERTGTGACVERLRRVAIWYPSGKYETLRAKALGYARVLLGQEGFERLLRSRKALPNWKKPRIVWESWPVGDLPDRNASFEADLNPFEGRWTLIVSVLFSPAS